MRDSVMASPLASLRGLWGIHEVSVEPPKEHHDLSRQSHSHGSNNRTVIPQLPRAPTFKRQQSELRDRLVTQESRSDDRRALSADRRAAGKKLDDASRSAPTVCLPRQQQPPLPTALHPDSHESGASDDLGTEYGSAYRSQSPLPWSACGTSEAGQRSLDERQDLGNDLKEKWVLNMNAQFRDGSKREKFFVTYTEHLRSANDRVVQVRRRVTVSCDYRNAEPGSLEADLAVTAAQKDRHRKIYEAIKVSLPDIQFYNSTTNLKLVTADRQLHIHVVEDVNESIRFPAVSSIRYLNLPEVDERDVIYEEHISGYVYMVRAQVKGDQHLYVLKEIPGPDSVEEFLYEINALRSVANANTPMQHVIQLQAVVIDELGRIKGLIIDHAKYGALVDHIYDMNGCIPVSDRIRWAKQLIEGLATIHEAGFVQGDFTLSNVVIDLNYDAKIIDINRRGCPIGWEPPELRRLIDTQNRISMFIGIKTDLYQLGMVLWAIGQQKDDPERHGLVFDDESTELPQYYRDVVSICLSQEPQGRLSAKDLLRFFPVAPRSSESESAVQSDSLLVDSQSPEEDISQPIKLQPDQIRDTVNPGTEAHTKQYIDPVDAVEREDIFRLYSSGFSTSQSDLDRPPSGTETGMNQSSELSATSVTTPYSMTSFRTRTLDSQYGQSGLTEEDATDKLPLVDFTLESGNERTALPGFDDPIDHLEMRMQLEAGRRVTDEPQDIIPKSDAVLSDTPMQSTSDQSSSRLHRRPSGILRGAGDNNDNHEVNEAVWEGTR